MAAADLLEEGPADLAGVGAAVLGGDVLGAEGDAVGGEDAGGGDQGREGGEDEEARGAGGRGGVALSQGGDPAGPVERLVVAEVHLQAHPQQHG